MDRLKASPKTIGVKQSRRVIRDGNAELAFLALDAEDRVLRPLRDLCAEYGVPVTEVPTMAELGAVCGIDIGASVAVITKGRKPEKPPER